MEVNWMEDRLVLFFLKSSPLNATGEIRVE